RTIVIDHHKNRDLMGTLSTFVDSAKASCCEVLYEIIERCKLKLDERTASLIYAGLVDDTGCFLHDNTTAYTHYTAQNLINLGADFKKINYHIIKLKTLKSFEMNKQLDGMVEFDNGVGYIAITYKFMKDNNFSKSDIGDYVNKLVNLENCKISFVVTEKQVGVYSVSLRCLAGYDVALVASKFNGGGHKQAAGCECRGKLKSIITEILKECHIAIGENNV
ncbi:MAG: DHH family phosphoesterase, partial [Clostridia bacterium]|nr:DHH family phosphoesterase [Clostridia bacterium]